ncbi:hypothetical protein ATO50_04400 [Aeromonas hydrophila]|nr:hypothetical protein ATO50_04400 [Aeromonas hydrophila]
MILFQIILPRKDFIFFVVKMVSQMWHGRILMYRYMVIAHFLTVKPKLSKCWPKMISLILTSQLKIITQGLSTLSISIVFQK